MRWVNVISVAPLTVVWIAIFLTTDSFSANVERSLMQNEINTTDQKNQSVSSKYELRIIDLSDRPAASPPVHAPPPSETTSAELVSSRGSELVPVLREFHLKENPLCIYQARDSLCCSRISRTRIPCRHIKNIFRSADHCRHEALVLVTTSGRNICIDPNATWFQCLPKTICPVY